jgi:hypothetical protein
MKNKKIPVSSVPKYNRKIIERGKNYTPNTHKHEYSLSWLCTDHRVWIFERQHLRKNNKSQY